MTRTPFIIVSLLTAACSPATESRETNAAPAEPTSAEASETNAGPAGQPPVADEAAQAPAQEPRLASACLSQDGRAVPPNRIRAIGTEPFWGAAVEGRCVTYSHPEDQAGTRVWTKFSGTTENGTWEGALSGKPFVMRTRPQPGCSDGMSDRTYPIAVSLTVGGEERSGCAFPN